MMSTEKLINVYSSLEDLVGEITSGSNLQNVQLENVQKLFLCFLGCLCLVLLTFLMHCFLFKHLRKIKLVRYSTSFFVQGTNLGVSLFTKIFNRILQAFSKCNTVKRGSKRFREGVQIH